MNMRPLAEIASVFQGGRHRKSGLDFVSSGFPAFGAGGQNGFLDFAEFDAPGVILSSIGARCGKCFYAEGKWTSLANTQIIFPESGLADAKFLWFQLNDENRWHRSGTGQPFIKPSDVKSHMVFAPPLEEQKRIAAILDKADSLRRKRHEALRLTDDLFRSVFLDMFGDVEKPGWAIQTVEDMLSSRANAIRTGPFGSQLLHSEFVEDGIAVLGIDNAVNNEFRWGKPRFITEEKYDELRRYTVRPGDVIITIMGTVGRCAIVPEDIPTAINTKHLCCITLDHGKCLPEFLHAYFLTHPLARKYLSSTAKGAIMDGLNMSIIKAMPVPEVPMRLQEEYRDLVKMHTQIKTRLTAHQAEAETLFASLQQRAFSGQL